MTNNAINSGFINNADGFEISGGTSRRSLVVSGSDINMTGSGSNTYTFPSSTGTLVSRDSTDTLTNKILTSATITTGLTPTASDGAALGSTTLMFSDLFLASGAVINFNNGDATITHSADLLAVAGATLRTNDLQLTTGSGIRTGTTAGNTLLLQARDVDGASYTTFATLTANNTPTFDIQPTSLTVNGNQAIITTSQTPASAGATGTQGTICWDSSYIYICIATNTWKRVAISTW